MQEVEDIRRREEMPTALELTREGWKHYVEAASRRLEPVAVRPEGEEARKQLLTRAHKAAVALKSRLRSEGW